MKKKACEKIPYMTLPEPDSRKTAEYAAVADIKDIGGEDHLFVEVYRNKKECCAVPKVRIVLTEKDFATYFPETGTWSRGSITDNTWDSRGLVWREDAERIVKGIAVMKEENVLYSAKDLERIQEFLKETGDYQPKGMPWWEGIERKQKNIRRMERQKKYERRAQALKARIGTTPQPDMQRVLQYADNVLFHNEHYLYYKKHGVRASIACTKCGGVSDERWKRGISYEGQFERVIGKPRSGDTGVCPMCGALGKFIPQGRAKHFYRASSALFLGERYQDRGMVIRYIKVEKEWILECICGEKEYEMYNACEKLSAVEAARSYFEPGKKVQTDFHKHDPWRECDFWDDCNLSGMVSISIAEAAVMPETYSNIYGTFLQYSAMEIFGQAAGRFNPVEYLERYIQMPQIEMLVKMGMLDIVKELVECRCGIVADADAGRMDAFLGIWSERVKQLSRHKGDIGILETMQMEKRIGQRWTEAQVEQVSELKFGHQISEVVEYMTVQQFLNRVSKYAGCEYGTGCSREEGRLHQTAVSYLDYLNMRRQLGYDLGNTVYLFPRDLRAAHMMMVTEYNQKEADKRIQDVNERYPMIRKNYRKFRNRFYYEDDEFLIRPARNAGEIVMEGRLLHHCVGGDSYLEKHNRGMSVILFLRGVYAPQVPYITVEIETDALRIRQWYGESDKKPDEKRMQKWLDNYISRLKCAEMSPGEEAGQMILAYA